MKLSKDQKAIIRLKSDRHDVKDLAEEYNVSIPYIYKILGEENPIAYSILSKMIPVFVEKELKVELEPEEIEFVKQIYQEVSS